MSAKEKSLLLHVCCAPCALGCLDMLSEKKRPFKLFFSNSNLATQEEYEKRLDAVKKLAGHFNHELLIDPYNHHAWLAHVARVRDYEKSPEKGTRCRYCFDWSLSRTSDKAASLNMNFTTSLTVSPHKNTVTIFEVGSHYLRFEPWDFKENDGFNKGVLRSRKLALYRQNFCGCEFSSRK